MLAAIVGAAGVAGADAVRGAKAACVAGNTATVSSWFPSSALAVNPFNRTRNLNDVYVTAPGAAGRGERPGHLEKFRLRSDGAIVDRDGSPAVDVTTGSIRPDALSLWPDPAIGDRRAEVAGAGAPAGPRRGHAPLYTDLTPGALTLAANTVGLENSGLTPRRLGLAAEDMAGRARLINAALGADAGGVARGTQPVTVVYGGTPARPTVEDAAVLLVTDDGRVHAFDADTGRELWSFVPLAVLPRLNLLHHDLRANAVPGGAGGKLRIYRHVLNGDGPIDRAAGDRVYLVFGMGRGGSGYYAFDITNKTSPVLLWRDGPAELPLVGETWSTPAIARVNIAGAAQNAQHLVVIVGGGYDPAADRIPSPLVRRGNAIYMLDLLSGALLWRAGPASARGPDRAADLLLDRMTDAIPADIRVLDLHGEGYADRMYAADAGGRIWRFDIHNGQPPATLVAGGVFAALGAADGGSASDARRFYHAPDVALIRDRGSLFLQLSVGSGAPGEWPVAGDRAPPQIQHYFYGLRDYDLGPLPQASYGPGGWNSSRVLTNRSPLVDATAEPAPSIPPGSPGWRMTLGKGETVLGEARTFGGEVFFTTFSAHGSAGGAGCRAGNGAGRLYVVNARTGGQPADRPSRHIDLPATGIAAHVDFVFPSPDPGASPSGAARTVCTQDGGGCRPDPVCLIGLTSCGVLPRVAPVRTTWSQRHVAD